MSGLSYQKVVDALFEAGMEDAIAVVAQLKTPRHYPRQRASKDDALTLTFDKAVQCHKLYATTNMNYSEIGRAVGVSETNVGHVIRGNRFADAAAAAGRSAH